MKRLAALLLFFQLILAPCAAQANSYASFDAIPMTLPVRGSIVVTSPFGWRTHPIYGTAKFHSGTDLAAEENQPVLAAASGIVSYAGWISGYGNAVIIEHENGISTLYAHNNSLTVWEGASVRQGEQIAIAGSTGNSTGPHVHFEIRRNGEPVSPVGFISQDLSAEGEAVYGEMMDSLFYKLNFDAGADFGKPIREAVETVGAACTSGLKALKDVVSKLFVFLLGIDLAVAGTLFAIDREKGSNFFTWLSVKLIFFAVLSFMLLNWSDVVGKLPKEFFSSVGALASGSDSAAAEKLLSDPTDIVQKGAQLIAPLFTELGRFHGIADFAFKMQTILPTLIFALVIMGCFVLVGIQIAFAYIEFYIVLLFSFVSFVFAGEKHMRKYAANALNGVFAVSIKLLFFTMFAVMMNSVMQNISTEAFFSAASDNKNISKYATGANITSLDEFMARIRSVESSNNYNAVSSLDGSTYYGAYQINTAYWDDWCSEAKISVPAEWSAENQDRVARCIMGKYYKEYGNWHDVAVAWNGGAGSPTAFDRILSSRYGEYAIELLNQGKTNKMVALHGDSIVGIELDKAIGNPRQVPPDSPLIATARNLGICLG
jgi:hypothetical protein